MSGMKLPKQLEKDGMEAEVRAVLENEKFEIDGESGISIPSLKLNPELRNNISYAKNLGELTIGYEMIEKLLASERKGLQQVDNQSDRISRLLIVTNDGSPRFYRELKFLQHKEGGRVLVCLLDVDSLLMGEMVGLKERSIKAIMVTRKNSVVNMLKALTGVKSEE